MFKKCGLFYVVINRLFLIALLQVITSTCSIHD